VFRIFLLSLLLVALAAPAWAAKVLILPCVFVNSSLEQTRPEELERLRRIEAMLAESYAARGHQLLDPAPLAGELERVSDLRTCDCEVELARRLGAEEVVVGWVQKISNLILEISVRARETAGGRVVRSGFVSIRGNTDESWTHGMRMLIRRALFPAERAAE